MKYLWDKKTDTISSTNDSDVWGAAFGDGDNRIVEQTDVGSVRVSTVFIGLDHNFFGKGPPILFETMIFSGKRDGDQDRYCTSKQAKVGHLKAVKLVKRDLEWTTVYVAAALVFGIWTFFKIFS